MKFKGHKKKIIILIASSFVILLACGTFKGYQSFRHDQHQAAIDMDNIITLFNMQLRVPDERKPGNWINLQPYKLPNDNSFDMRVFSNYVLKKVTFQKTEYKDVEPQWFLLPTRTNPKFPNYLTTEECLKNFNNNLLYNPDYEQYRTNLDFNNPLTMTDLVNNPKKVVDLVDNFYDYSSSKGFPLKDLIDRSCPSQYLPK